jgi:hypothetical protein
MPPIFVFAFVCKLTRLVEKMFVFTLENTLSANSFGVILERFESGGSSWKL